MSSTPPEANPLHQYRSSTDISHSREKALNDREFELLLEGAKELSRSDHYYDPDPELTVYLLGRLGLRRGELAHLQESWINWREKQIEIPATRPCDIGKDGSICGDCVQKARQRVEHADDLTLEEALRWSWTPKTEAGIRDVYYGHDTRAELYLERYFDSPEYTRYEPSGSAIARRCNRAAELAPVLESDDVHPHGLRATAASYLADRGLESYQLAQVMGWICMDVADSYLSRSTVQTARALDSL